MVPFLRAGHILLYSEYIILEHFIYMYLNCGHVCLGRVNEYVHSVVVMVDQGSVNALLQESYSTLHVF